MDGNPRPNETEQILVQLLADDDGQVRRRACEALLRAGQNPPLDALIPLLKSADASEALAARRLLESVPMPTHGASGCWTTAITAC
jgi:HEAT repeat protein